MESQFAISSKLGYPTNLSSHFSVLLFSVERQAIDAVALGGERLNIDRLPKVKHFLHDLYFLSYLKKN
jgi:hypothetical protein